MSDNHGLRDVPSPTLRVLVIDDSEVAREAMESLLRSAGLDVFSLPSPIGATREVLRRSVDIVVIDVNMPAMRGDHLAALFRANARLSHVGLVLVSSTAAGDLEMLAREVGADAFLTKSMIDARLVDVVRSVAERHKS